MSGLAKDDMTLEELKVTKGAKMMVVGSTLTDVLSISAPTTSDSKDDAKEAASSKEPLSQQKVSHLSLHIFLSFCRSRPHLPFCMSRGA